MAKLQTDATQRFENRFALCLGSKGKKNVGDSRGRQDKVELIQGIEGEIGDRHADRCFISEMKEAANQKECVE